MSVSVMPPAVNAKWSAVCSSRLTPVQVLQMAAASLPHLRSCISLQPDQMLLQTTKLYLVMNVLKRDKGLLVLEFRRLSGDRSVFRLIARTIYSSLKLREPSFDLCTKDSCLVAAPPAVSIVVPVSIEEEFFARPSLESDPAFSHQDTSVDLIEILLNSASSPFLEVHREALICLSGLSLQPASAQILRQITDQLIPVLCLRLKSHDASVCSMAARIGINTFGNGVAASSLSTSEQSSLCRALIRKMKERSAPVDSAIESLYDVIKQSFGMKMSPPICT